MFVMPRLESGRGVRQPVLIEALPQSPDEPEPKNVAALDSLPEGDAPAEKEAEVEAPLEPEKAKIEEPKVEEPEVEEKIEEPKIELEVEESSKPRSAEVKRPVKPVVAKRAAK